ncbi:heat shock protein HslJ [Franconibacter pulveris]|uniref:Heat-inducible protein n=1 Tax=Franconibacter pulveris TaxID=435910 RepID=A0A0J8VT96_9ENTR|nr:heat shock protein HslJ [Franconibacter pulveris]KMV35695.1 heat-inducible protein [Franconibacter pulveris]
MKKYVVPALAAVVLAGCATPGHKAHVTAQQLVHHRYVLSTVDGAPLDASTRMPEISFGENLHVAGSMCNRFMGQGELHGDVLKVKGMASTRMLCAEPRLNELDTLIGEMLTQGAKVSQSQKTLVLETSQHTLTYKLADLVN